MEICVTRDAPAYVKLVNEYEEELPPFLRHRDALVEPPVALAAFVDGEPAGCIGLAWLDARTALMRHLYVRPAFRKHGVARTLVDAFIETARELGAVHAVLDTDRTALEPAYRLYRSYGFEECEPYGPVDYDTPTFMRLKLSPPG